MELKAGQVALLHNWTIHSSGVNTSTIPRRAFSVNYMDGRTKSEFCLIVTMSPAGHRTALQRVVHPRLRCNNRHQTVQKEVFDNHAHEAGTGYAEGADSYPRIFKAVPRDKSVTRSARPPQPSHKPESSQAEQATTRLSRHCPLSDTQPLQHNLPHTCSLRSLLGKAESGVIIVASERPSGIRFAKSRFTESASLHTTIAVNTAAHGQTSASKAASGVGGSQ